VVAVANAAGSVKPAASCFSYVGVKPPRAIIIGGSIAGLFAGALLRRVGWAVDIYERSSTELFGRGVGIVTHDELLEILQLIGASLIDLGVSVRERVALDTHGQVVERLLVEQIMTSWDRLYHLMRAAIPDESHHLGHDLLEVHQIADAVTVVFSNGERACGDLLIGADGFRSTVRQQYAPGIQPVYAGYVEWRGFASEADLSRSTHQAVFDKFAFCLPPNNINLGYPMPGPDNDLRPGRRRYNWVWHRAADASRLHAMLRGSDGIQYEVSVPPHRVRQDLVDAMRKDASNLFAPALYEVLAKIKRPFITPVYDHCVTRMTFGRVALIGDAAAAARPHVGMGVAKAASDAAVLAASLQAHGSHASAGLADFECRRLRCTACGRSRP
jgi:2-polyprenyl-6-methoxyphenol hydroxylase-like FAD-dependent oxidoreductase